MKTKYPKVSYSLFQENNKYVVKIHNPTKYKDHPLQIKRTTGLNSERPARKKALEIIDSFFSDEGQAAIAKANSKKLQTVSDMLEKYYHTIYLPKIKVRHTEEKVKKLVINIQSRFKHIKRLIGNLNPATLDMDIVNEYMASRQNDRKENGGKYALGSINFEVTLLKAAVKALPNNLKYTVRENMRGHNKFDEVPREVILKDSEYDNMLEKFAQYDREHKYASNWSFYIEVLYFCGIRGGQLRLLEHKDINWDESCLEFPAWKTKHLKTGTHVVQVDREILLKLKKCYNSRDIDHTECVCAKSKNCKIMKSDFVFVNKHRRCQHFQRDKLYSLWNGFCEELGYVKFDKYKKGEQESTIHPHDIRRTRIIKLIQLGVDRKYIMLNTGHMDHSTFDRYNIVQRETMRDLIEGQRAQESDMRRRKVARRNDLEQDYQDRQDSIWE